MSTVPLSVPDSSPVALANGTAPGLATAASTTAWPISLLGVPFDPVTLAEAVARIDTMIAERNPRYVVTANVDFLVQARRDAELRRILVEADLVLCDGTPLIWASRWLGNSLPGRAAGADLVPILLQRAALRGWKIFMLGATPEVVAEAARRIEEKYPTLPKVEFYSPPFRPLKDMDHASIAARIKAAQPDLLLVAFGCPKQEKWISMNYRELGVPVAIGVGGTIDFLAGHIRRAPKWMGVVGVEWMFRLLQEPRRLFKRYADDILHFFPALLEQRRCMPPAEQADQSGYEPLGESTYYGLKVRACEQLNRGALEQTAAFWQAALDQKGHCMVDLGEVKSIDSTGLAFLESWQKRLAKQRRNLILFRPSAAVRQALDHMGLTEQFIITDGNPPGGKRATPRVTTAPAAAPAPLATAVVAAAVPAAVVSSVASTAPVETATAKVSL